MEKYQITFKGLIYELDVEEISSAASGVKKTVSDPTPVQASPAVPKVTAPVGAQTALAPMPVNSI